MSLLTSFYDYQFLRPVLNFEKPNYGSSVYTDYNSKEMNEIQKRLYLISRLFMSYNNLLLLAKSVKERKFLDKVVDAIFITLFHRGGEAASKRAKEGLKTTELVSVFGKRRSKLISEMRKQLI